MNNTTKTILKIMLIVMTILITTGVLSFGSSEIPIFIDEQKLEIKESDLPYVPPMIVEGRTMVPYRILVETMGGTAHWEEKASMVTAILGDKKMQLTVNNNTIFVNGVRKEIDVAPILKNGRVLIPIRQMEYLDCKVDWDVNTRTVFVETPPKHQANKIESIKYEDNDGAYRITVTGIKETPEITSFSYDSPERFGVNIKDSVLAQGIGSIKLANSIMSGVRFSQFDTDTVRIVVDLKEKVAGRLSFSDDGSQLYIDFGKSTDTGQGTSGTLDSDQSSQAGLAEGLPELDWKAKGKIVVLDPGHGGKDPGATGKINGKLVLLEKDLNLEIALRVNQLLKQAGANVVMLRETDIWMELYERPEIANKLKADLFVSIHNNGYDGDTLPNGVEVLYYDKVGIEEYGVSSKQLAQFIQDELYLRTGLKNRPMKSSPHLAVLNKSLMPAVIIEGGFLSNPGDLTVMLTDEYKQGYAMATAIGIIKALNYWVDQEK